MHVLSLPSGAACPRLGFAVDPARPPPGPHLASSLRPGSGLPRQPAPSRTARRLQPGFPRGQRLPLRGSLTRSAGSAHVPPPRTGPDVHQALGAPLPASNGSFVGRRSGVGFRPVRSRQDRAAGAAAPLRACASPQPRRGDSRGARALEAAQGRPRARALSARASRAPAASLPGAPAAAVGRPGPCQRPTCPAPPRASLLPGRGEARPVRPQEPGAPRRDGPQGKMRVIGKWPSCLTACWTHFEVGSPRFFRGSPMGLSPGTHSGGPH